MSPPPSFTLFPYLPPELRIQIWTEALAVPSVWAVKLTKPNNVYDGGPLPHSRTMSMTYVGPGPGLSPHHAGLSCREARDVMERLYKQPLRGGGLDAAYWIYLERAVVAFVGSQDALAVLNRLDGSGSLEEKEDEVSRLRHVALVWENRTTQPRTCVRLAGLCPGLRTVIVQRVEAETRRTWVSTLLRPSVLCEETVPVVLEPDQRTAARYVEMALSEQGPEIGEGDEEGGKDRESVLQCFGERRPRLHVLAPAEGPKGSGPAGGSGSGSGSSQGHQRHLGALELRTS